MSTTTIDKPVMNTRIALIAMTAIFFMWGFITELNDVLIPHLKSVFELKYWQAMLIQFCFFGAYLVMAVPAVWVASTPIGWAIAGAETSAKPTEATNGSTRRCMRILIPQHRTNLPVGLFNPRQRPR